MAEKAILFDATKCMACRACQVACKQWNENSGEKTTNTGTYENPPDLSARTWVKMKFTEVDRKGSVDWLFTRQSCMHCTDAACIKVCPNGTLYRNEWGAVAYTKETCTGCGYCADACPFNVPRLDGNRATGFAKMGKCSLCTTPGLNRVAEGWQPACVKTCPSMALAFGDRDAMVADGRQRVSKLKSKGWNNALLYGDKELSGLHVVYVLNDRPDVYGLPAEPRVSGTTIAWQDVIQPLGWAVGGLTIVGLGLNYVVARANVNKEKEKEDARSNKV